MQFAIYCIDKAGSSELRMTTRAAHLKYIDETTMGIVLAGPLLGDDGAMQGSLFIVEADDRAAVERFSEADPYRRAGLFQRVEIRGFRSVFPR